MSYSSLEWHQQKCSDAGKIYKSKIELQKETVHQNIYSGLCAVIYKVKN